MPVRNRARGPPPIYSIDRKPVSRAPTTPITDPAQAPEVVPQDFIDSAGKTDRIQFKSALEISNYFYYNIPPIDSGTDAVFYWIKAWYVPHFNVSRSVIHCKADICVRFNPRGALMGDQSSPNLPIEQLRSIKLDGLQIRMFTLKGLQRYLAWIGFNEYDSEHLANDVHIAKQMEIDWYEGYSYDEWNSWHQDQQNNRFRQSSGGSGAGVDGSGDRKGFQKGRMDNTVVNERTAVSSRQGSSTHSDMDYRGVRSNALDLGTRARG